MKRAARLTRSQKEWLTKRGITEEQQKTLRFYAEVDGVPVFVQEDGIMVVYEKGKGLVKWVS